MKVLIVEDDFVSRKLMLAFLTDLGECDIAVNGSEAIEAFIAAQSEGKPYQLIMLDIMMPEMNGQEVLRRIRHMEETRNGLVGDEVKIVMTTALKDSANVMQAFENQCDGYLAKPIEHDNLLALLKDLGFEV